MQALLSYYSVFVYIYLLRIKDIQVHISSLNDCLHAESHDCLYFKCVYQSRIFVVLSRWDKFLGQERERRCSWSVKGNMWLVKQGLKVF